MLTTIARKPRLAALTFIPLLVFLLVAVSGAQAAAPKHLNKKAVAQLIATAKSPADHLQLASYYKAEADRLGAEANEHAEMAKMYRARPTASETKRPGASDTASHCENLAQSLAKAANEARELAASHEQMAKDAGANPQ